MDNYPQIITKYQSTVIQLNYVQCETKAPLKDDKDPEHAVAFQFPDL